MFFLFIILDLSAATHLQINPELEKGLTPLKIPYLSDGLIDQFVRRKKQIVPVAADDLKGLVMLMIDAFAKGDKLKGVLGLWGVKLGDTISLTASFVRTERQNNPVEVKNNSFYTRSTVGRKYLSFF